MKQNQQPAALLAADALESIGRALGDIPSSARHIAIHELRHLHARVQQLEEFAKAVEQYGVLLRAGGAAPHDLKDLSAALEQCVELAQGVLK